MRFLIVSIALVFLGTVSGCVTTGSNSCGSSSNGCGTSGCKTGGCAFGGGAAKYGHNGHSHGICDCEHDDYCSSRSPWVRAGGAVGIPVAPTEPIPAPSKLPDLKNKKL